MAAIKLVYVGGGSSRAAGTMASLIHHGAEFAGSHVTLVDVDADRLALVKTIADKLIRAWGVDMTVEATTDRRAGMDSCDAVLTSFRPGGFEARVLDERIPLKHGVIGQETQGPGGMFMALRSLAVFRGIVEDLESVAPGATIFNYTNPINLVSQAITDYTSVPIYSMCEGPLVFPPTTLRAAGLDPQRARVTMAGLNHQCWSTSATYDGADVMPLLDEAWERVRHTPEADTLGGRMLHLAVTARSIPAEYFQYYYFRDEVLREQQGARMTRAEVILSQLDGYWRHYAEQVAADVPDLDPQRSRGGIHELELAIDVMSALYNDTGERLPVNLPNVGGVLHGFSPDTVVEMWCTVDRSGVHPEPQQPLPAMGLALVQHLAEFQKLAAKAGWEGGRTDGIRAMAANPLVPTLAVAEELYDELAWAHRAHLPERLLR